MKRRFVIIMCLALFSTMVQAQSSMTDNQIVDFVIEQNSKVYHANR